MRLTSHFTLEEFTASQVAARHGISNSPDETQLANLRRLAEFLEGVRFALGNRPIIITSGFRSFEVNRIVGGSPKSAHMRGLAADFICPSFGSPLDVARRIVEAGVPFDQLIHEYGRWVHYGIADGDPDYWRHETLTACRATGYMPGLRPC